MTKEIREDRRPTGRVGHPPRAGEASTETLRVRVTIEERDRLRELAEVSGLTVSEYVRRKVLWSTPL